MEHLKMLNSKENRKGKDRTTKKQKISICNKTWQENAYQAIYLACVSVSVGNKTEN